MTETKAVYFSARSRIPKEPREKKRPILQYNETLALYFGRWFKFLLVEPPLFLCTRCTFLMFIIIICTHKVRHPRCVYNQTRLECEQQFCTDYSSR